MKRKSPPAMLGKLGEGGASAILRIKYQPFAANRRQLPALYNPNTARRMRLMRNGRLRRSVVLDQ